MNKYPTQDTNIRNTEEAVWGLQNSPRLLNGPSPIGPWSVWWPRSVLWPGYCLWCLFFLLPNYNHIYAIRVQTNSYLDKRVVLQEEYFRFLKPIFHCNTKPRWLIPPMRQFRVGNANMLVSKNPCGPDVKPDRPRSLASPTQTGGI